MNLGIFTSPEAFSSKELRGKRNVQVLSHAMIVLSNPRHEELVNSVFLHLYFIFLLRVTMEGQQETNKGHISQQRYKESKNAETKKIFDF